MVLFKFVCLTLWVAVVSADYQPLPLYRFRRTDLNSIARSGGSSPAYPQSSFSSQYSDNPSSPSFSNGNKPAVSSSLDQNGHKIAKRLDLAQVRKSAPPNIAGGVSGPDFQASDPSHHTSLGITNNPSEISIPSQFQSNK